MFHAARQDIEIVWNMAKTIPHPIFDTQVAAMVLGYGDSISYDQLVQRITGDTLDKSHRFTDWTRRPLSDAQITYALVRRHASARRLSEACRRSREARAHQLGRGGDGGAHLARDLPRRSGARLGAAQDPRAQAEGARRADGGRRLARARGADARRAARARAQGRRDRRYRRAGADHDRAARSPALAAEGLRALALGRADRRGGQARARARSEDAAAARTLPPGANGTATVELLKVLLRMTAERHGVAAKVIATVDDLDRIAADDAADVPALKGWRRDLFGEKALALKQGRLALAVDNGKVVTVDKN